MTSTQGAHYLLQCNDKISNTVWINHLDSYIKGKFRQSFKVTEESSPGDFRYGHISTIS